MSDVAKVKAARAVVERAARAAGVREADIRMALGGGRQAAKKPAKAPRGGPSIESVVAEFLVRLSRHGIVVDLPDLQSERVLRAFTGPRAVAMAVARLVLGDAVTLAQIGEFFGRDHSTVVAAINRWRGGAFAKTAMHHAAKETIAHFRNRK